MLQRKARSVQEAQGAVPALGGHALGTAAGHPQRILCHSTPKGQPPAVTLLSGNGRSQPCSPESTGISRPLPAPDLTSMRPRSKDQGRCDWTQTLLQGHKGSDFCCSRTMEESQSVTRAIGWDRQCQETVMKLT